MPKTGRVTVYKAYEVRVGKAYSPFQRVRLAGPGVIAADISHPRCTEDLKELRHGIHCFRTKAAARRYVDVWCWDAVVRITANYSDLVGANENEALFRKVSISASEYRRITSGVFVGGLNAKFFRKSTKPTKK